MTWKETTVENRNKSVIWDDCNMSVYNTDIFRVKLIPYCWWRDKSMRYGESTNVPLFGPLWNRRILRPYQSRIFHIVVKLSRHFMNTDEMFFRSLMSSPSLKSLIPSKPLSEATRALVTLKFTPALFWDRRSTFRQTPRMTSEAEPHLGDFSELSQKRNVNALTAARVIMTLSMLNRLLITLRLSFSIFDLDIAS
jgi:hypothetical protein